MYPASTVLDILDLDVLDPSSDPSGQGSCLQRTRHLVGKRESKLVNKQTKETLSQISFIKWTERNTIGS